MGINQTIPSPASPPAPAFIHHAVQGVLLLHPLHNAAPSCVQLLMDLHKQNKGRARGWQGMAGAELCRALCWGV